jgi:hypothetical protein
MKLTNNEAENLVNYYFEKAMIGIFGTLTIGSGVVFALYKGGSYLLSHI